MLVKDKLLGMIYKVLSSTENHYLVEDKWGEIYHINKSQAVELDWSDVETFTPPYHERDDGIFEIKPMGKRKNKGV